ncbi:MAG: hypothetical protein HUK07_04335, partial [Bacteroidaceae bacterium]|nr:hypothetical protein [Bacteroidaceae bacterium]
MFKKLRLIVEHCTPQYIYAQAPIVGACVVDYGAQQFVYLRKILKPGMTINVLDASQLIEHAVLFPHYIIVEPDFLVDISSIAGCFKEYGHHALNFTVSRLEKSETTQPILLGNYAGAALDEIINERDGRSFNSQHSTVNIQQSVVKCFQSQPLEYITCPNFNSSQFKKDAIAQAHNIREIVRTLREKYDLDKAILEPTFVCEALGLQGRVDMMTTDFRLLIEQKSGKNFNLANSRVSDIGFHVESHYVQLLLYFSVLYFNFGVKKEEIDFYLLYSKYELPKGLLPVEFNDNLIYEALMLRNQIVATDLMVAEKGFQSVRPYLRPEVLNVRGSQSKLWKEYQYPQLEQQLGVLHRSGGDAYAGMPLFRYSGILLYKYFDAMATFVYREQRAAWLGESNEQTTAVSYLWKMSLEEKIETGNIMIANAPDPSIHTREGELKDSLANDLQKLTLRLS